MRSNAEVHVAAIAEAAMKRQAFMHLAAILPAQTKSDKITVATFGRGAFHCHFFYQTTRRVGIHFLNPDAWFLISESHLYAQTMTRR